MLYPSSFLFSVSLILGTILTISSTSWFGAWMGLELNLLSFLAIISTKNNQYPSESALKYFLIQTLSSLVIMLSALMINLSITWASMGLTISLFMKSGMAPFHFWFPVVMESLSWPHATILMTLQKVAPLSLLSYLTVTSETLFVISIILSAIAGAIGGLNQTSLQKLMTYSSINHMSWMLIAMMMSELMWLTYLTIYCLMVSTITFLFFSQQSYHINSLIINKNTSTLLKMITYLSLLSLGGLPPFTGFFIKWMVIQELVLNSNLLILLILLSSSLITLFFYMRMVSFSMFMSLFPSKWTINKYGTTYLLPVIIINFMGMFMPSLPILMA